MLRHIQSHILSLTCSPNSQKQDDFAALGIPTSGWTGLLRPMYFFQWCNLENENVKAADCCRHVGHYGGAHLFCNRTSQWLARRSRCAERLLPQSHDDSYHEALYPTGGCKEVSYKVAAFRTPSQGALIGRQAWSCGVEPILRLSPAVARSPHRYR